MSQSKNASAILILASIFLLISSAWNIVLIVYYDIEFWGYIHFDIIDFIGPVMGIVASLLLMIGFIIFRGGDGLTSATPTRLCPKCGRNIDVDAKFCPYCGWKPTATV